LEPLLAWSFLQKSIKWLGKVLVVVTPPVVFREQLFFGGNALQAVDVSQPLDLSLGLPILVLRIETNVVLRELVARLSLRLPQGARYLEVVRVLDVECS
jgi:hypothetical protein